MLWVVFAAMALAAGGALVLPHWRARPDAAPARESYDLEIYRDQLAEIERDRARGVINDAEAGAARTEIARRALAADAAVKAPPAAPQRTRRMAAMLAAALAPVIAFGVYLTVGSPGMPGQPLATRIAAGARHDEEMVDKLKARLKEHPEDVQGWLLLARSNATLGRVEESLAAWREAMRRGSNPPGLAAEYGEAIVDAANGTVTPEALAQFEAARKADPGDPRALFYLGLAKEQAGESREALQIWTDLAALSPPDAAWMPLVRERMRGAAAEAKIDPASVTPSAEAQAQALARRNEQAAPKGPSAADADAVAKLPPEERTKMIRGMVDQLAARLETDPNDLEGWRRLARARRVLGDNDQALAAYAKAAALAPSQLDVQTDYARALFERIPKDGQLPPEFVAAMRHILELDPNHGDALWFVGLAEYQAGHRPEALRLWQRLAERLPPDSKERRQVETQIDRLKKEN